MSRLKKLQVFVAILGCLLSGTRMTVAQTGMNTPSLATNSLMLKTEIRGGETVGNEQVKRVLVTFGTNQFLFRMPFGFRLDASNPHKLLISDQKDASFITIRWISATQNEGGGLNLESCRSLAAGRFPQSTIAREFSEFALNRSVPAFDLQWFLNGRPQSARVMYISLSLGALEIALVADSEQFKAARTDLIILLASLQSDETGPIKIELLPDFS